MAFTVIAYSESNDSATLTEIAALADGNHVTVSGDDVFVPKLDKIGAYHFFGANFTQGRIGAPSLLTRGTLIDVEQADLAIEPGTPPNYHDVFDKPIQLKENEGLRTYMAEDSTSMSRVTALIWLMDSLPTLPAGDIFTVLCTGTTTLVANAWTNGTLTFAQQLPEGEYAIVGAKAQATGLQAFRVVVPGYAWRPGAMGTDADGDLFPRRFRNGGLGVWAKFNHRNPPSIDYLSNSADTTQRVLLDLIKIG